MDGLRPCCWGRGPGRPVALKYGCCRADADYWIIQFWHARAYCNSVLFGQGWQLHAPIHMWYYSFTTWSKWSSSLSLMSIPLQQSEVNYGWHPPARKNARSVVVIVICQLVSRTTLNAIRLHSWDEDKVLVALLFVVSFVSTLHFSLNFILLSAENYYLSSVYCLPI